VRELLAAGRRRTEEIVVSSSDSRSRPVDEIVALARSMSVPVRVVSRSVFTSLASSAAPQGVVARAEPIVSVDLDGLVAGDLPFLVVLDEVTDPQNVGAIFRSALGAGATGIVIGRRRSAPLSATVLKAAAGAVEHLSIAAVASVAQGVADLSRRGVWTVGLDPHANASISDLQFADRPIALVAGAEGRGLAPLVRRRCDVLCRVPLYGPVESLNVSVAVALAAFAIAERRAECDAGAPIT
jgi:23S rRNA (guanosine2251-2'-O)-methyltransferase